MRGQFLTLLAGTYKIYVPLLAVILPAVFFSVPRIVREALAGLNSVVKKAPEIDPRRPGRSFRSRMCRGRWCP